MGDKELSDAIIANDLAKVTTLLKANPALVRSTTAQYTPLHRYYFFEKNWCHYFIIIIFFVCFKVLPFVDSLQLCNWFLPTSQMSMIREGNLKKKKKHEWIWKLDSDGSSSFYVACQNGHLQVAQILYAAGADPALTVSFEIKFHFPIIFLTNLVWCWIVSSNVHCRYVLKLTFH